MGKRKANAAMSKTKAKAMRRKPTPVVVPPKAGGKSNPSQVLLGKLLECHAVEAEEYSGLSFEDIMNSLGMNNRNTGWRNAWKELNQQGFTEEKGSGGFFTSKFGLTDAGLEEAATDEYKEALAAATVTQPKTNAEHQERIKAKLMNARGEQIFDLLMERGPLSRNELAKILGISDRGAYFSYALQQLKNQGYAEVVGKGKGKKVRLAQKAFLPGSPEVSQYSARCE